MVEKMELENIRKEVNEEKVGLLEKQNHPTLVNGKTGSGKTFLLLSRIAYLIQRGETSVEKMLNIVFDRGIAKMMKKEFAILFPTTKEPEFMTIHTFAFQILRKQNMKDGKETWKAYRDTSVILRKLMKETYSLDMKRDDLRTLQQQISFCKNTLMTPADIANVTMDKIDFPAVYATYEKSKAKRCIYDYDDLLVEAYHLLNSNKELLEEIKQQYAFLHVDDAQELSFLSHQIIEMIAKDTSEVFFLADQDLSIASYRIADMEGLSTFTKHYTNAKVVELHGNYRNNETILELANKFYYKDSEGLTTTNHETCEIKFKGFSELAKLYIYGLKKAQEEDGEIAFLYRDFAMAIPLIDIFKENDIPFTFHGNLDHFLTHRFVKDMWNFIELLVDSRDMRAFFEIYDKLGLDISKRVLVEVSERIQQDDHVDIYQALMESSYKVAGKKQLASLMEPIRLAERKNTLDMVLFILDKLGYRTELRKTNTTMQEPVLLAFQVLAQRYPDPDEFLYKLGELKNYQSSEDCKIVIESVESVHGYAYDRVCMIDCLNDIFPKPTKSKEEKDRERKLFLLGMTRAKHQLEFFASKRCHLTRIEISPYLYELNKENNKVSTDTQGSQTQGRKIRPAALRRGTQIRHVNHGVGRILKISDGMIHVQFENEVKQLNLNLCIINDLIKHV